MISLKSKEDIAYMKQAGRVVAQIIEGMANKARPGVSTGALDLYAESECIKANVIPAFKGYLGFPACVCLSVNEEVVHGIPSLNRFLQEGDILGIDFGVIVNGWYADSARTVGIGNISPVAHQLLEVTEKSLKIGIQECQVKNYLSNIGHQIQKYVEKLGYGVVRDFVGHGIGKALHEDPPIPNYGPPQKGPLMKEGMVFAIEPMITHGSPVVKILKDGWTVVTEDRSLSAHFEHTVVIGKNGPEILTSLE